MLRLIYAKWYGIK